MIFKKRAAKPTIGVSLIQEELRELDILFPAALAAEYSHIEKTSSVIKQFSCHQCRRKGILNTLCPIDDLMWACNGCGGNFTESLIRHWMNLPLIPSGYSY